ncbi:HAD family hydrolase [Nesterenkonia sp. F]|uniref:HAD family hydrolase n=1 Tax=Nesterenkonia sp. F TaxID=795955 RepID=UPI000255D1FA|nr:HAD family hydrolase [Nesterenkonia sp. F]
MTETIRPARSRLDSTRLIASDIDGTILSYDDARGGRVTERTVSAFRAAAASGVRVVLVTGRPVRWIRPVADALGDLGTVICSNGAVVYDLAEDRLLRQDPLAPSALFEAKDRLLELDPEAAFSAETLEAFHLEEGFTRDSLFFEEERMRAAGVTSDMLRVGPLDETLGRHDVGVASGPSAGRPAARVVKLLVRTTAMDPDAFLSTVRDHVGHLVTVTHSAPGVSLLELSAPGVDKASALRRMADEAAVGREEVIAFGDMPNDVGMLEWAGTSWAVGSAHPLARDAAGHVAGTCDDDGVAEVLEDLLAGGAGCTEACREDCENRTGAGETRRQRHGATSA